jgi:fatty acid elongase 3
LSAGGSLDSLVCESFDHDQSSRASAAPSLTRNSGALFFWCYIFYLSKYYDFFDTLLLVLRKKELGFLHMYHHASLPLLCVLTMNNWRLPVWTGAIINSGVHVVMYYYFGLRMAYPDRKIWWRKYVTVMQIAQFTLGFLFIAYFLRVYGLEVNAAEHGHTYVISMVRRCAVDPLVVALNSLVNLSFFVLFVQIYIRDNFANKDPKNEGACSAASRVPSHDNRSKKAV